MMKYSFLSFLILLLYTAFIRSQVPDTSWTISYGGDGHDYATSMAQMSNGDLLVAGVTYSFGAGDRDIYLARVNIFGDTLWTKTYGDSLIDNILSIESTADGGFIMGGTSSSHSGDNRDYDFYLVKLDSEGNLLWQNYCTDSSSCLAYDVVQTNDGGYMIAGAGKAATRNFDLMVMRTNSFGDTLWTRRYVIHGRETWEGLAYCLTKTHDGDYIVAGESKSWTQNCSDIYVIKLNDSGDTIWTKLIDYQLQENAWDCVENPEGDIVLVGWSWDGTGDITGDEVYLAKLAHNGDLIWQKTFAYPWPVQSYNDGWSIIIDPADNGYIIAADTRPDVYGQRDTYLIKADRNCDTLWTLRVAIPGDEGPLHIINTDDGGFAVCGFKYVPNPYGYTYKDCYVVKFESMSAIPEIAPGLPHVLALYGNYPNPFNTQTIIHFNLACSAETQITIYNALGQQLQSLSIGELPAGEHHYIWDSSDLASGTYLYRIIAGDYNVTNKMILLK